MILLAVAATIMAFSSCKKDETKTDLLTKPSKGWVLSEATSSPHYALQDGTFATDLMKDGYLDAFELDDIIKFKENGGQTIDPGKLIDPHYGYQAEVAATWSFNDDETILNMQIPFFYNDEGTSYDQEIENCDLLELTEDELRIKYTFNDDLTKVMYSFTLTYVPAK